MGNTARRSGYSKHPETGKTERFDVLPYPPVCAMLFILCSLWGYSNVFHRPETYSKADTDPRTGKALDVGVHDLEGPGSPKENEGFFEKGLLKAAENDHTGKGDVHEVKVVGNGHCHGMRC